ncbi:hypothetical protein [Belnapia moabensis]|uniref:hypothetical protein n=1 Tax=Belnapia moabensis TaxID=365533 RepID=UPI0012EDE962|nr:hypothetical protein [Belnapia moabensis]
MDKLDLNSPTILEAVATATDRAGLERLRGLALDKRRSDVALTCATRLRTLGTLSWIAASQDSAALERMRHNALRERNSEVTRACRERINVLRMADWHLNPERPRERELMHWFVDSMERCQALKAAAHGRATRAVRTEQMLKRHGAIKTMARAVLKPKAGVNFVLMVDHELAEWTIESGCLRFADLLAEAPAAIAVSRTRLADIGRDGRGMGR